MKMITNFNDIGKNFQKIIYKKGLSKKFLAEHLGIPYSTLLDFLNDKGGRKYLDVFEKLSGYLNVVEIDIYLEESSIEYIKEKEEAYMNNTVDLSELEPEYRKQVYKIFKLNEKHKREVELLKSKYIKKE